MRIMMALGILVANVLFNTLVYDDPRRGVIVGLLASAIFLVMFWLIDAVVVLRRIVSRRVLTSVR